MDKIKVKRSDYGLKAQKTLAWGNALRNNETTSPHPPPKEGEKATKKIIQNQINHKNQS